MSDAFNARAVYAAESCTVKLCLPGSQQDGFDRSEKQDEHVASGAPPLRSSGVHSLCQGCTHALRSLSSYSVASFFLQKFAAIRQSKPLPHTVH